MPCTATETAAHGQLVDDADTMGFECHISTLAPHESASGQRESEIVVETTADGTVPNRLLRSIYFAGLGVASVQPANHPDFARVVVR